MLKSNKMKKCFITIILTMMLATAMPFSALAAIKSASHYYTCRGHGYNCQYVTLSCEYSKKTAKSVWFSNAYFHWPNGVKYGSRGRGTGYARGTYTAYSGLVTEWVSLTFQSRTNTIYIYF